MPQLDTITAIATPLGLGGIGIIRLSGPQSWAIGLQLTSLTTPQPRYVYFRSLNHPHSGEKLDEGCVTFFQSPASYTGEDVVEIQVHASPLILKLILEATLALGARLAQAGEFTKRAFIHGKLDLTKAESVIDLIHAQSNQAHAVALNHLKGGLYKQITLMRSRLMRLLEQMEGSIDFPEEVEAIERPYLKSELTQITKTLQHMIRLQDFGKHIQLGVQCVIVGKPNVGKSSLFNQILGENRAIISPIAGTTRDFLEAQIELGGLLFRLIDTAGVRKTTDMIEHLGVKKVHTLLQKADVVLWMVDSSLPLSPEDMAIYDKIKRKKNLYLLLNKSDKKQTIQLPEILKNLPQLALSAKKGLHIQALKDRLYQDFSEKTQHLDHGLLCNVRQLHCIKEVKKALSQLLTSLTQGFEDAMLVIDLKQAILHLGEVTGEAMTEEVLDGVFSRFCVGK